MKEEKPVRWHVNPETGNPGRCRAKSKCRFGDMEADHHATAELAAQAYEASAGRDELKAQFEAKVEALKAYQEVMDAQFTTTRERLGPFTSTSHKLTGDGELWRSNYDKLVKTLNELDLLRDQLRPKYEPKPIDFPQLIGFEAAQAECMANLNETRYSDRTEHFYVEEGFEDHFNEVKAAYLAGETVTEDAMVEGYWLGRDKLLADLVGAGSTNGENKPYSVLIFPEKDLKPVLERLGVEGVSVSVMENGREQGLVYTVMEPNGNSRSFSFYEHRNTDSMVINCQTNWDPTTGKSGPRPAEATGSRDVIAEFSGPDRRAQAEALGFFLKEAQKGELPSDTELMMTAEKLDWNAILSEQVPEFKDFLEKNGYNPDKKRSFEE